MGMLSFMICRNPNLLIVSTIIALAALRPMVPFPLCPIGYFTTMKCPTCGLTTAIRQILAGDVFNACVTHFGVVFVFLILLRAVIIQFPLTPKLQSVLESSAVEMCLLAGFFTTCIVKSTCSIAA